MGFRFNKGVLVDLKPFAASHSKFILYTVPLRRARLSEHYYRTILTKLRLVILLHS